MLETRPNIAFAISVISRLAKNPFRQQTKVVKTIMRYLKATRSIGITYGRKKGGENFIIKGYSDSNRAGDYTAKKSVSGFVFILNL